MVYRVDAAEVDSFSARYNPMKDSLRQIDNEFNKTISIVINDINSNSKYQKNVCDQKFLYKKLRKYFSNKYFGKFTKWVTVSKDLDRNKVPLQKSIYKNFTAKEAIILGLTSKLSDPGAALMTVGGFKIGDDKFEHFFGSGFKYFKAYYLSGKPVDAALNIGKKAEFGILGAKTTGVIAYADMVANFNGMRFWNHVLNKYTDVLDNNSPGPYITCDQENNKWVKGKRATFKTYLDYGFDEGINCSQFRVQSIVDKVKSHIFDLETKDRNVTHNYVCPIRPEVIPDLLNKYGKFSNTLINLKGHSVPN